MNKPNELLRLDLQFFADEPVEQIEPTEPPAEPIDPPAEPKTFTQEELDKIVTDRIAREKKKLDKFADYEDLKSKAAEYEKQLEEKRLADLTEQERLQEIAKKHEEEKQTLSQQLAKMQAKTREQAIVNAFIKAAPGVNIPADRIDAALKLADISAVNVGEDGAVEGLGDVMSTLVEQYSFLVGKNTPKQIGEPSNGGTHNEEAKTLEAQLAEAKKAKNFAKVIEISNKIAGLVSGR